jgi:hypothetical protein
MAARDSRGRQVLILEHFACKSLFLEDFEGGPAVTQ